jgi:hypothetical protein
MIAWTRSRSRSFLRIRLTCGFTVESSITSVRDLAVGQTACDQLEHLALARRQLLATAFVSAGRVRMPARRAVDHRARHRR